MNQQRHLKIVEYFIKYGLKILFIILAIWCILFGISSVVGLINNNKQYEARIESLDKVISQKESFIKAEQEIIKGLEGEIKRIEVVVEEKDKARAKGEKENARIKRDRDKWKEKVENLPASVVVIETRIILETKEVWEKPDGILFSLTAAKDNLAILGDFSLVEEDRDKWKDNYNIAKSEIGNLKVIIVKERKAKVAKDRQIFSLKGINVKWEEKFNLSESQKRKRWWKGIKTGVIAGSLVGLLFGFVLGK